MLQVSSSPSLLIFTSSPSSRPSLSTVSHSPFLPSLYLLSPPSPHYSHSISPCTADNTEGVCIGSDPHLGIRLPEGSLLCYSFQGEQNSSFNIISDNQLEMNALFVSDSQRVNNTWIGSIGITVYHNGRKTTSLQFTASDHTILLGSRVQLSANTVSKISFSRGKLTLVETPHNHTLKYPRVGVEFLDSDLKFTVAFIKNEHINLEWHSIGEPYIHSRGVVGKLAEEKIEAFYRVFYLAFRIIEAFYRVFT